MALLISCVLAPRALMAQDGSGVDETRVGRNTIDWEARLAHAAPRADQPIYVIVHSAVDCKFCQRWKGRFSGEGELSRWAKDHPLVQLVIVERPMIDGVETQAMYPPELLPIFEKRSANGSLRTGVPLFEAAIGDRIVYRTYGYSSWGRKMFPALQSLESRRGMVSQEAAPEKD
jgi:hypothetical protein